MRNIKEKQIVDSYNKRKINQLKKRRDMRKTRILFVRLRYFARIISILLLIGAFTIIIDLPQWYLNKNIFTLYPNDFLEIEGNNIVSNSQIMARLKNIQIEDKPIYLIDTKPIEEKLLKLDPIKKVFIRRYWFPARLRIVFDERTPVLSIALSPKVQPIAVFTDDNGSVKILDEEYLPLPKSLKTYKIITFDQFSKWKSSQIEYMENFSYHIETATGQKMEYIDIRNPDDVFIQLEHVKLRIGVINGNSTLRNIDKVVPVLPEAMKIKDDIEYIDLRWDNVSIKLKDKQPEPEKTETEQKIGE